MPVIAFNYSRINAAKLKEIDSPVKTKTDVKLKEIKKKKLPVGKVLEMHFEFRIVYDPKVAELELGGYLYYLDDEKVLNEIEKEWKSKKTFSRQDHMT